MLFGFMLSMITPKRFFAWSISDWSWRMKVDFTDKVGGAFSTGGGQAGGKEFVVVSLAMFMLNNRMVVAGPLYRNDKTGSVWGEVGAAAMTGPLFSVAGRKVAVVGAARSGVAAAQLLVRRGAAVTALDCVEIPGFLQVHRALHSRVDYRILDFYDLPESGLGAFDMVLIVFGGLALMAERVRPDTFRDSSDRFPVAMCALRRSARA